MAAGANVTWTIVASVASSVADGTTLSNSASIATNNTTDPVAANNSDTETTAVIARADLQVEKSDSPDPVIAGSNLTYTIKVTNLGPSDNSGFTLSDALPAGTSFVSATSSRLCSQCRNRDLHERRFGCRRRCHLDDCRFRRQFSC